MIEDKEPTDMHTDAIDQETLPGQSLSAINDDVILRVSNLSKTYIRGKEPAKVAIENLDCEVRRGEFVSIVGPSGAGKTTLLRCISGLLAPSSGSVVLEGVPVIGPPRGMAVVFQEYGRSLLPWFTNERNVVLPLQNLGIGNIERLERAREAIHAVSLDEAALTQFPWQLSGGMQQRVAIARALAYRADLLVMDEPFASVDAQTRFELEDLILRLQEERNMTVLFVTHDIDEAVYLSDRVVVLSRAPATVVDVVDVPLERPRNQVRSKADSRFSSLRTRVLSQVMPQQATR